MDTLTSVVSTIHAMLAYIYSISFICNFRRHLFIKSTQDDSF
jgi:hypothetical protein